MEAQRPRPSRKLVRFGLAGTVIYLLIVGYLVFSHQTAMLAMAPNEWGDFLAGTFGPMAFLWLVLGYFQQGEELRLSADALWLQSEELKNSVEQQRALVEATREQIAFEKKNIDDERAEFHKRAQPILLPQYVGFSSETNLTKRHNVNVENTGQECSNVSLTVAGELLTRMPLLRRGESIDGWVSLDADRSFSRIYVDVTFTDINGNAGSQHFLYDGVDFQQVEP